MLTNHLCQYCIYNKDTSKPECRHPKARMYTNIKMKIKEYLPKYKMREITTLCGPDGKYYKEVNFLVKWWRT